MTSESDRLWDWLKSFETKMMERFDNLDCQHHDRQIVKMGARLNGIEKSRAQAHQNNKEEKRDKRMWLRKTVVTLLIVLLTGNMFGLFNTLKAPVRYWLGLPATTVVGEQPPKVD